MAEHTRLDPPNVAAPVGGYSQTVGVTGASALVWVSGQIPETVDGTIPETFEDQCRTAWRNLVAGLSAHDLGVEHLVKITTYLTDRGHAEANRVVRHEFLGEHRPANTVVVVQTLDPRWLLEVEGVAAR